MAFPLAAAVIGGGLLGGLAGGMGKESTQTTSSSVNLQDIDSLNRGRSGLESRTTNSQLDLFKQLQGLVSAGPGQEAIGQSMQATEGLAAALQAAASRGGAPSQVRRGGAARPRLPACAAARAARRSASWRASTRPAPASRRRSARR